MIQNKKKVIILLLLMVFSATDILASTVKRLDIHVVLHDDGSASIEEHWDIDVDDDDAKTEWYVLHRSFSGMQIEQLKMKGYVPGKTGLQPYETLDSWDVEASREEKTGKCGLHNNDQEICWGFGDYGRHEYVVSYVLTGLVQAYDTNDGFNHCFVDMDCTIEQAQVTITATDSISLSETNTRRWAFGYNGKIDFTAQNQLVAISQEELSDSNRIIIMLEFDKGVFHPVVKAGEPWADKKQRALDNSDFESEDMGFWDWVMVIVFLVCCLLFYVFAAFIGSCLASLAWMILVMLWWVVSLSPLRTLLRRRKLGIKKGMYFRNVKPQWSLVKNKMIVDELAYFYGMTDRNIIGALLLKLLSKGDLTITQQLYKNKMRDMLKIEHPVKSVDKQTIGDDRLCQHVLKMLTLASGDDLILQPNEFKEWCKRKVNATEIKNFMNLLETHPDDQYLKENAADLFGLKAFLKDFSLLSERGMREVTLWDEYMIYAEFFDMADHVSEEMAKVWPEYKKLSKLAKNIEVAQDEDVIYMFSDAIYTSSAAAIERLANRAKSGSDGFSSWASLGGGGGFSGGGGGGGR